MHKRFILLKKGARKILSNFLLLFLNSKSKNYIKANSELIFLKIFSKIEDDEINDTIEKFIMDFNDRSLKNDNRNLSAYLLIEIYKQLNTGVSHLGQYSFYLEGIDQFDFTKKEITCYLSILTNNIENKIEHYFDEKKIEAMVTTIPSIDDIYFFTHDIFYLTYLNSKPEFFDLMSSWKKEYINEYIFSCLVFCLIEENIDLLGELLICYRLVNGKIDESNPIIDMSLVFIEQYLSEVNSKLYNNESIFIQTYHTILVILMLVTM